MCYDVSVTETPLYLPSSSLAQYQAKRLANWLGRWDRWMKEVDRRIAGLEPKRVAMPSKNSKWTAYEAAGWLVRYAGVQAPHAENVADLKATLAAFRVMQ
jgi:hypothetical protein